MIQAVELGWIPRDWNNNVVIEEIKTVCDKIFNYQSIANKEDKQYSSLIYSIYRPWVIIISVFLLISIIFFIKRYYQMKDNSYQSMEYTRIRDSYDEIENL